MTDALATLSTHIFDEKAPARVRRHLQRISWELIRALRTVSLPLFPKAF